LDNLKRKLFWVMLGASIITLFLPLAVVIPYVKDYIMHFCLFLVLPLTTYFAFPRQTNVISVSMVVYILAAEFIQKYFIPQRTYNNTDIIAGLIGLVCALFVYQAFLRWREVSSRPW